MQQKGTGINDTSFGLTGLSTVDIDALNRDYDDFIGKKARRRRKERRARKKERRSIRFERRRLKNDDRRADTEAKRTQTAIMKATMLSNPAGATKTTSAQQPTQGSGQNVAPKSAAAELRQHQASVPLTQKAGFGGNTMVIVIALLIVGGYLFMNKQQEASEEVTDLQPS
ncbi:MAG: hypothetical protein R8G66_06140 [Cytophagales bacterium]|nr:hypothetical protein [Cytophagales bacterium]